MPDETFQPLDSPEEALQKVFGYETFRPPQREVIEAVVEGRDLLAIMPTGSGKSLCYQLPACLMEGTVLVVSPLIALMEDQLGTLREVGVPSTLINSSLSHRQRRRRINRMQNGHFKLVYVAPERFRSDRFCQALDATNISLLAVDEAHCISHWGHDFRPDYLRLSDVREQLDEPPVLGLTATATRQVRADILEQMGLDDGEIIVGGFERPNLFFEVHRATGDRAKTKRTVEVLESRPNESAVVYCATRKQVEDVARRLRDEGLPVGIYHAGLSDRNRRETQDAFMAGDLPILVATNAFGMGVDKPDIRAIIHYNITGSLEAYYQEAGRAGRDGQPALCLMLYDSSDRGIHDFFIENSYPDPVVVEAVWREVARNGTGRQEIGPEQIADNINRSGTDANIHSWAAETALKLLQKAGHLSFGWQGDRPYVEVRDRSRMRDLRVDWERLKTQRKVKEDHLDDVINYATGRGCRQAYLLHYFGASPDFGDQCGRCDACGREAHDFLDAPPERRTDDSAEVVARKLLSAVARTRGRADELEVAAVLRGSTSKRLARRDFDALSTWGVLDDLAQFQLVSALRKSEEAGLVDSDRQGHLDLTDAGVEVMTADAPVPPDLVAWLDDHLVETG